MNDDLDAALRRLVHQPTCATLAVFEPEYEATKEVCD